MITGFGTCATGSPTLSSTSRSRASACGDADAAAVVSIALLSAGCRRTSRTRRLPGTDQCGPWIIERAIRDVREDIDGLPEGFTFHDLRHYLASLLIASGADIKTVQARLRHATARTTLDTYGHLWPDADESTRTAIGAVVAERLAAETTADALRTDAT
jgi:Phage integrase family